MSFITWPRALFAFFIFYIGLLAFVLIKSRSVDHSLVVDNYYQDDIDYNDKYYIASVNRNMLNRDLQITVDEEASKIVFKFDEAGNAINGKVVFYRPSDKNQDVSVEFAANIDSYVWEYSYVDLKSGKWVVKVRWVVGDTEYYKEEMIYI